jgi:hypothetical protein
LRVGVCTPSAPPHAVTGRSLRRLTYGMLNRVGAVVQLPGAMRLLPAAQYVERRILSVLESQRLCAAVRMLIYHVSMLHELCHVTHLNCLCRGCSGQRACLKSIFHSAGRPFSYNITNDELASCKLAGVEWDDGVAGAARFGPRRNASHPPRRLHLQRTRQLRLSKCMMLLYHPPPSDACEPSPSKGVERRGVDSLCGVGSCWLVVVW